MYKYTIHYRGSIHSVTNKHSSTPTKRVQKQSVLSIVNVASQRPDNPVVCKGKPWAYFPQSRLLRAYLSIQLAVGAFSLQSSPPALNSRQQQLL